MDRLLIGYTEYENVTPAGIEAGALGPQPPVKMGIGVVHAYRGGEDRTLCDKFVQVPTRREWPHTHGGEDLCNLCQELAGTL